MIVPAPSTAGSLHAVDCLPCGLFPFDVTELRAATYILAGTTCRVRVPPQRFDALEALIRLQPAGLVSCQPRPWGSALQGRIYVGRVVHPCGCRNPLVVGRSLHFRVWFPADVLVIDQQLNWSMTAPLMGFFLPGGVDRATGSHRWLIPS